MSVGADAGAVVVVCPDRAVREALVAGLRRRDVVTVGVEQGSAADNRRILLLATGDPDADRTAFEETLRHAASVVLLAAPSSAPGKQAARVTVLAADSSLEQIVAAVVAHGDRRAQTAHTTSDSTVRDTAGHRVDTPRTARRRLDPAARPAAVLP